MLPDIWTWFPDILTGLSVVNMVTVWVKTVIAKHGMVARYRNMVTGYVNVVIGYANLVTVYANVVIGYGNLVTVYANVVVGYVNLVTGYANVVVGYVNLVTGYANVVIGYVNLVTGYVNMAIGYGNMVTGVNKNPTDATVCRYLFTAKLLYMFRVSQHPSSGEFKTVSAASGTGHTTWTTTTQMLRWFPRFQVATTCFSCSPPDVNLVVTNFIFCLHVK